MANAGYIIVKSGEKRSYKAFYSEVDKGSAKPAFCYPGQNKTLTEEVDGMKRALDNGYVDKTREMSLRAEYKLKRARLDAINQAHKEAKKLMAEDKDAWMKRRTKLGEEIADATPTYKDVKRRRVNPFTVLKNEKNKGLEEKKREYTVISRLAGEESNTSFLQRDHA